MNFYPQKSRGRKHFFNEKQTRRMLEMKAEGLNFVEIARVYGVTSSTVSRYLKKLHNHENQKSC